MKLDELTAPDYAMLEDLATKGARNPDLATALDISSRTLQRWLESDEELAKAIGRGRSKLHEDLVGVLYRAAMKGDAVSAIFLLKTRFAYSDRAPDDDGGRPQVALVFPPTLTPEQYAKLLEAGKVAPDIDAETVEVVTDDA